MRKQDIGKLLRGFLGDYLPRQRNASENTILAYRDALKLLLAHVARTRHRTVADLALTDLDRSAVLGFLESLELTRSNQVTTRNLRLTAIRSFFRYVSNSSPEDVEQCQSILGIPLKRGPSKAVAYLTVEEMNALLGEVSNRTPKGRRDDALIRFMYNTGARVQEAIDVVAADLRLDAPAHVRLLGKGRKERLCPLWADTVERLRGVLEERAIAPGSRGPVFVNREGRPLTRFGVHHILATYAQAAAKVCPSITEKKVHPHVLRHTTAMHLLQSGVDLNTVRCWLGHVSVTTTSRYVEADLDMKRRALETTPALAGATAGPILSDDLLAWLEDL